MEIKKLQINLKLFLYFLFCSIYKSQNTPKVVPKEKFHHPEVVLAAVAAMTVAVD
ncbi:MAG: hypothetical protein ABIQ27_04450 [Flavobacterium sp.]|uniref:hypothetical protein n=1 Tax=Flavobacterium sp. TaxID=239 RepID=UPI0032643F69